MALTAVAKAVTPFRLTVLVTGTNAGAGTPDAPIGYTTSALTLAALAAYPRSPIYRYFATGGLTQAQARTALLANFKVTVRHRLVGISEIAGDAGVSEVSMDVNVDGSGFPLLSIMGADQDVFEAYIDISYRHSMKV